MVRTELSINETTSHVLTATLKRLDATNTLIPLLATEIDSIEVWLREEFSGETINSRQKQDVLNANGCEMHATTGLFTWNISVDDTEIVNPAVTPIGHKERHLATFTVTWDTTKQMHFEILLLVKNLRSVPQEVAV